MIAILVPLLWLSTASVCPVAQSKSLEYIEASEAEAPALERFDRAIDEYVALHRRIERALSPDWMFDVESAPAQRQTLRQAVVAARATGQRGDVFSADVAQVVRARLQRAIRWHRDPAAAHPHVSRGWPARLPRPTVNEPFDPGVGAAPCPILLRVLPELSEELDYRFLGGDLVLIDTHAGLVVDILPAAFSPADECGHDGGPE